MKRQDDLGCLLIDKTIRYRSVATCEEEEDAVAHGAQHGGEALADDEGEEHVGGHVDPSACSARLQGLDLPAAVVLYSVLTVETGGTEAASMSTIDSSLPRWQDRCGSALRRQLARNHVGDAC